jgi:sulfur carrier protein
MRLKLNGKEREMPELGTVEDLIRHLEIHRMIVVEHNGEILARDAYSERVIQDGDALEIVHMVGGG